MQSVKETIMDGSTLQWVDIYHPIVEITKRHVVIHMFSGLAHGFGGNPSYGIGSRTVKRLDRSVLESGEAITQGQRHFKLCNDPADYVGEHPENTR